MTLVEVVIALAISGLIVTGIILGYVFCTQSTIKDSLYMAANARAMERIEQARGAQWDIASFPVMDQLVATNFPDETNVVLDLDESGSVTNLATLKTYISQLSTNPPLKIIRVDCIWQFQGEDITNSIETCRSPD